MNFGICLSGFWYGPARGAMEAQPRSPALGQAPCLAHLALQDRPLRKPRRPGRWAEELYQANGGAGAPPNGASGLCPLRGSLFGRFPDLSLGGGCLGRGRWRKRRRRSRPIKGARRPLRQGSSGRARRTGAVPRTLGILSGGKMIPTFLLPLLGLLLSWEGGFCLVPPEKLQQMSETGSKYIDREVENAISGVKQMKILMDETKKDHQQMMNTLEETKKKKEEALFLAKETEQQLTSKQEVCNETMLSLWEECKPCLKQTCMRFYSRTCHSGAGLVGRQLEEFLNHSSPFSIWVNGERVDSLMDETEEQGRRLHDLEERYGMVADGVEDLFQESQLASGHLSSPFSIFDSIWNPFRSLRFPSAGPRVARNARSLFLGRFPPTYDFSRLFQPSFDPFENDPWLGGSHGSWLGGFPTEPRNFSNDRMVCREIRRNSSGCLRMKGKCEKCQAILNVDCSQTDPNQSQLREHFQDALRRAEQFSRMYDNLFKTFQEEMFNTTRLLDQLNSQFGWVSRLANITENHNRPLKVTTVLSRSPSPEDPSRPSDTEVTIQLFDLEPQCLTVPGSISWEDPRFMEIVADKALHHFRDNEVL